MHTHVYWTFHEALNLVLQRTAVSGMMKEIEGAVTRRRHHHSRNLLLAGGLQFGL